VEGHGRAPATTQRPQAGGSAVLRSPCQGSSDAMRRQTVRGRLAGCSSNMKAPASLPGRESMWICDVSSAFRGSNIAVVSCCKPHSNCAWVEPCLDSGSRARKFVRVHTQLTAPLSGETHVRHASAAVCMQRYCTITHGRRCTRTAAARKGCSPAGTTVFWPRHNTESL
jgi:hypothetical protein